MRQKFLALISVFVICACQQKIGDDPLLAKVNGEEFHQSHLNALIKSLPESKQMDLKDSVALRQFFEEQLHQKLFALAAKDAGLTKNTERQQQLIWLKDRVLTQYYYEIHLEQNAGFSPKEIDAYYSAHPKSWLDSTNVPLPKAAVLPKIIDSLIIKQANIDSFYQAQEANYQEQASCELAMITSASKEEAIKVLGEIKNGMSFADAAKKFSSDSSSAAKNGNIGRILKSSVKWELGSQINTDSLFFDSKTKISTGTISNPLPRDGESYMLLKPSDCVESRVPPLHEVRNRVVTDIVQAYKKELGQGALDRLKAKYHVKPVEYNVEPDSAALKKYYEANKSNYMRAETYTVYHLQADSEKSLKSLLAKIKDSSSFANQITKTNNPLEKEFNVKSFTIKRDHVLPYGIGMLPGLFAELDSLEPNTRSTLVEGPDGKWHSFWLLNKQAKVQKPFDRVFWLVKQDFVQGRATNLADSQAILTFDGGAIRESQVNLLRTEIPQQMQSRYSREDLANYLVHWILAAQELATLGYTEEAGLKARLTSAETDYWANLYRDSVYTKTFGLDSNEIKNAFNERRAYFVIEGAKVDPLLYARDVASALTITENDFKEEYGINPDKYLVNDTLKPLDSLRYTLFQNLKQMGEKRAEERYFQKLKEKYHVEIVEASLIAPKLKDAAKAYKQAQDLHTERKLDEAVLLYQQIRTQFPGQVRLQDSVCFGLAQIYIEQEKFSDALAEYRRVSFLYPDSPNEYKAEFMVGFIYSEHMKQDSAAVRQFKKMLQRYPKTDLSDDADWMIRNIQSGGALMPKFEDSTAVIDSADTTQNKAHPDSAKKNASDTSVTK